MDITQQYALDLYRSAQQGVPAPPAPGQHDWRVAAEVREYRRLQAATADRPATGGPLTRLLHALRHTRRRGHRTTTLHTGTGTGARSVGAGC
ncbi:hypothetical protein AAHZ94_21190 [Streptomyces sp. HSW2009]|uniref:hypothetical protein n=1 Tax=Streptomyces sp. HSW2009 TaxID=3142890 RepID=UPI0032EF4741